MSAQAAAAAGGGKKAVHVKVRIHRFVKLTLNQILGLGPMPVRENQLFHAWNEGAIIDELSIIL